MTATMDVKEELTERFEFFFSDTNLRSDVWMQKELEKNDGYIQLDKLMTFNTIKKITDDAQKAIEVVESMPALLKLNEAKDAVGRVTAFDKSKKVDNLPLSLFVEDLPIADDGLHYAVKRSDLKEAFEAVKEGNKVTIIRLRFDKANKDSNTSATPIGSAFVEFESAEMMDATIEAIKARDADTDPFKIGGATVKCQPMGEWLQNRKKNKRKADDKDEVKADEEEIEIDIKMVKGCVIKIKGLPEGCDRESLRDSLKEFEFEKDDLYIDYSRGQEDGAIRFTSPNEKIQQIVEKLKDGSIKVNDGAVADAFLLEGEAEEDYWNKFIEFKKKQAKNHREKDRQRGRGGGRNKKRHKGRR
mmetsp:Transcript_22931/g.35292  ORF Transcript_22931/g.35292 Transcript_22931/m.35292 type:complete len:358 (-) Transcript_22931:132-1205(-)|eukprot:CAMPEP_0196817546 /NCGR_PEP_ID=MMETSP1362-20130617/61350_1 /TAXON_ID=163516 /ORGANISM="Leptocylindrus danicus, Strain CCMP1856" /LENGTH=357 /DNA_ID=CAMNT_0042195291 /DNA_START=42 /DNA_END=1115 /DNA_ORIENTATION=-